MPTRLTVLLALLLSLGAGSAFAETRFEVACRLIGYDLVQATGSTSTETDLPTKTVTSGREAMIELAQKYYYPKEYDAKGRLTMKRIAYLGIRMPIYVRQTEDGKISFLLKAELCQREDVNDPFSAVAKTTSSIQGIATLGQKKIISIGAPGGKKATLEITFTPAKSSIFGL